MKKFSSFRVLVGLLFICPSLAFCQGPSTRPDTLTWKKQFKFSLNLNQAAFSSNWKAGGINSFGFNSLLNYNVDYKKGKDSWDNEIDLAFGFVNNAGQGYRKTADRMYFDTKYGYELGKNWNLFASLNFLSQFSKGFKYTDDDQSELISEFFAPAFITAALGFEYHPVEYFKLRLSPFAPRITIVNDAERFVETVGPEPYGIIPPDHVRFEWLGFQLMAEFNKDIYKNVNLKWRYALFANYETLEAKRLDHRLDIDLVAKIGKYFNVGLGGILLYDYDQDSGAQLNQAFSIGFLYNFQNYVEPKK